MHKWQMCYHHHCLELSACRCISAPPPGPMGGRHSPRWGAWWRRSWCRLPFPWSPPESCSWWEPSRRRRRCWRWSRGKWRCRTQRRSPPGSVTGKQATANNNSKDALHIAPTRKKNECFTTCIKIKNSSSLSIVMSVIRWNIKTYCQ